MTPAAAMPALERRNSPCAPADAPSPPRLHLAHIDGLRAVCALWVVLFHAKGALRMLPPALQIAMRWVEWGHFAVPVFIVISGFCLMLPVVAKGGIEGGARRFFAKRARRILPPYYAALVICAVVNRVRPGRELVAHVLLVHNLTRHYFFGTVNAAFWSIAVECQIYLLFPLFVQCVGKYGITTAACVLVPLTYILNIGLRATPLCGACAHYYGLFVIGAAAAVVTLSSSRGAVLARERLPWSPAAVLLSLLAFALAFKYGHPPRDPLNDSASVSGVAISGYNLIVALSVACVLISASAAPTSVRKLLSWAPLVWIGTFSYSIYLLHLPLLYALTAKVENYHLSRLVGVIARLGALVATIAASYIFHRIFERPFMSQHRARGLGRQNYALAPSRLH